MILFLALLPVVMMSPTSSHLIRRWLIVGLVILLAAAAVWWLKQPKPVAVVFKEVDKGKVASTIANTRAGTVEACLRTKLSTILGGRIEVLAVKEGDHVSKGQLLMKLWNDDQQAQSALAQTQLAMAQQARGRSLHSGRQRRARCRAPGQSARQGLCLGVRRGGCPRRGAVQARQLRHSQGRRRSIRRPRPGGQGRAGTHRALRAFRRHGRQDRR